VLLNTLRP